MSKTRVPPMTEEAVAVLFDDRLALAHWEVLHAEVHFKKCWKCGVYPESGVGYGIDKGVPDRIVWNRTWPIGMCLLVELKGEEWDWSSDEQKAVYEKGMTVRVQGAPKGKLRLFVHDMGEPNGPRMLYVRDLHAILEPLLAEAGA